MECSGEEWPIRITGILRGKLRGLFLAESTRKMTVFQSFGGFTPKYSFYVNYGIHNYTITEFSKAERVSDVV